MARLGAAKAQRAKRKVQRDPAAAFSVLAPSAILTPQRLRDRELARATETPSKNDAPALLELRMFLQMQSLNGVG